MFKKLIGVALFLNLTIFTNVAFAQDCVTGFACTIDGINKEHTADKTKETKDLEQKDKIKSVNEGEKDKGIFVDGKELNSPKNTEIFDKYDF